MKVKNIHKRLISQPKGEIVRIFSSLASKNDLIWPNEKWPRMKLKAGLKVDSVGGHGPIKYSIIKYFPESMIEFEFIKPSGFKGTHKFEISKIGKDSTELRHTIDIDISVVTFFQWFFIIKPLHNALLEDCLDKVENNFLKNIKTTKWNLWVVFLRSLYKKN